MNIMNSETIFQQILTERNQGHDTRKHLFEKLEKKLNRPVISFFTSFHYPVMIQDADSEMIEEALRTIDLSKGLAVIINSPGGSGLASERIINICKSYSGTGEFWTIVPSKAKSAATMICFGASKIIMSKTSELGPIDPQTTINIDNKDHPFSLHNLVNDYEDLFNKAIKTKGRIEPYLLQLGKYSSKQIKEYKTAIELSEDIAIRALQDGMMGGKNKIYIKKKIEQFLTPRKTKVHGRPIYITDAKKSGLEIENYNLNHATWKIIYELYFRTNNFVNNQVSKCVENKEHSYIAGIPDYETDD